MPYMTTESFGSGDQSWIGSRHALNNAQTAMLDISAFTPATHYPDGYIRSGQPVSKVGGMLVPYDQAEATVTGAGILYGHVLFDQKVHGTTDFPVPLFDHGRVVAANVPGGFTPPVAPAKSVRSNIVYI